MISELANKVSTSIEYHRGSAEVKAWGFHCTNQGGAKEYFKLFLDPQYQDRPPHAPSSDDARLWYRDYLRCIHSYLLEYFSNSIPRFNTRKVEFIFSVPTTWKSPSMIAEIEKLIESAGFGRESPNHRATIGLTEAEAAAVYASKQHYQVG
jgi:hypothetical protein